MCDPVSVFAGGAALIAGKQALKPPKLPPAPEPTPEPATPRDPKAQAARQRERDNARRASGRSSTMLTGSGGLTSTPVTAQKTLLGQ